jgi:hypothetical protein
MSQQQEREVKPNEEKEPNLKGTLISVSIVGGFLVITWVGALMLFLSR